MKYNRNDPNATKYPKTPQPEGQMEKAELQEEAKVPGKELARQRATAEAERRAVAQAAEEKAAAEIAEKAVERGAGAAAEGTAARVAGAAGASATEGLIARGASIVFGPVVFLLTFFEGDLGAGEGHGAAPPGQDE
jgi:hypothetical protein